MEYDGEGWGGMMIYKILYDCGRESPFVKLVFGKKMMRPPV
jgi:hypothetical protein